MLNKKLLGSVSSLPQDDNFENVTLLLNGDGTNGGQNNTFVDSSTNNFTITRNGNTTQGSFSPYGDLWSNYFDAGDTRISVPSGSNLQLGSSNFTVEAWVYNTSFGSSGSFILGKWASSQKSYYFGYNASNLYFGVSTDGTSDTAQLNAGVTLAVNTWYHLAAVRNGNTLYFYVNGTQAGTASCNYTFYSGTDPLFIGGMNGGGTSWQTFGYISSARLVIGTAVYTGAFTPSTTPLTAITNTQYLGCQSNRFIDNSSNNATVSVTGTPSVQRFSPFEPSAPYSTSVIGGSGYFDGSGDYLSISDSASFPSGTTEFCYEAWFYPTANTNGVLFAKGGDGGYFEQIGIQYNSGALKCYIANTSNAYIVNAGNFGTPTVGQWNHIAVYRSGNNFYGSLNGSVTSLATSSDSVVDNAAAFVVSGYSSPNPVASPVTGYISNLRLVTGSAVYGASNFTPPTTLLTAITGTQLLCNFTNASIADLAMQNNIETVGNAQVSTSVKKYGTGSLAFDGNGDYLLLPNSKPLTIYSSSPFTIEFWVYFNSVSAQQYMLSNWTIGADGYAIATGVSTFANNQIAFFDGTSWRGGSTTVTTGTWYHFAVSSSGASSGTYIYLNGTSQVSGFTCAGTIDNAATQMFIGLAGSGATSFLNGYIDDLRITNGVNRYPGGTAFTPPTKEHPTY